MNRTGSKFSRYILSALFLFAFSSTAFAGWTATPLTGQGDNPKNWVITCDNGDLHTYSGSEVGLAIVGPALCPEGIANTVENNEPLNGNYWLLTCSTGETHEYIGSYDDAVIAGNALCPGGLTVTAPLLHPSFIAIFFFALAFLGVFIHQRIFKE